MVFFNYSLKKLLNDWWVACLNKFSGKFVNWAWETLQYELISDMNYRGFGGLDIYTTFRVLKIGFVIYSKQNTLERRIDL